MDLMSGGTFSFVTAVMDIMATLFVILIGVGVLVVIVLFISDVTQTKSAIRRNYPVVGRFRYFFEHMGEFFRQYFFAMDREELPFNRAQRSWAYRAAKNIDNTVGFGSTRDLRPTGTVMFVNCPFPTLGQDAVPPCDVTIGPFCRKPYTTNSLFNISGMSFGA
ncbi:MAG: FMN-binding glutamate synthase family protein, partial [Zetaproteobacteria bacterium]|nr:FMN-binding glutamate synthase family protein [Zetaproteobacteria bacterium]